MTATATFSQTHTDLYLKSDVSGTQKDVFISGPLRKNFRGLPGTPGGSPVAEYAKTIWAGTFHPETIRFSA